MGVGKRCGRERVGRRFADRNIGVWALRLTAQPRLRFNRNPADIAVYRRYSGDSWRMTAVAERVVSPRKNGEGSQLTAANGIETVTATGSP